MSETNVQVTTQNTTGADLSPEMKTYYDKLLIANAEPQLVHTSSPRSGTSPGGGKNHRVQAVHP